MGVDFTIILQLRRTTHPERPGEARGLDAIWCVVVMPHSVRQVPYEEGSGPASSLTRSLASSLRLVPIRAYSDIARERAGNRGAMTQCERCTCTG